MRTPVSLRGFANVWYIRAGSDSGIHATTTIQMIFNSLQFIVFFVIVTAAYFVVPYRLRWFWLLLASCYFYMAFVPVYILILGFTIVIDYLAGILIEKYEGRMRGFLLAASLVANIGVLAVFKYYNFLNYNLTKILHLVDYVNPIPILSILLPVGLSFHTFQAMSYTIEVYKGNQKAERHFGMYALYVMFYPQLVAGPIERPQNILHQFREKHNFDFERFKSGLARMAFGFFKKVVIADRLAMVVDHSYGNIDAQNGFSLLVATVFYSFQIYCDFSGYSDIAIGAARIMGFELMENFKSPYLSKSIPEFWKRWHISLSTWFRDYLYIPLGGNRVKISRWYFNLMVVFLISGLWHGANWTFVAWGLLHGIYQVCAVEKDKFLKRTNIKVSDSLLMRVLQITTTFSLVTFAWIFFRAAKPVHALKIIDKIFRVSVHDTLNFGLNTTEMWFCVFLIMALLFKEKFYNTVSVTNNYRFWSLILFLIAGCYFLGVFGAKQFIYFQF